MTLDGTARLCPAVPTAVPGRSNACEYQPSGSCVSSSCAVLRGANSGQLVKVNIVCGNDQLQYKTRTLSRCCPSASSVVRGPDCESKPGTGRCHTLLDNKRIMHELAFVCSLKVANRSPPAPPMVHLNSVVSNHNCKIKCSHCLFLQAQNPVLVQLCSVLLGNIDRRMRIEYAQLCNRI